MYDGEEAVNQTPRAGEHARMNALEMRLAETQAKLAALQVEHNARDLSALMAIAVERTIVAQRAATDAREALLDLQRNMAGETKRPSIPEVWEVVREVANKDREAAQ